jgi:NAD+ kinase
MQTIAIIPKRSKPEASELAGRLATWLLARGLVVLAEHGSDVAGAVAVAGDELAARADLIVVLGGDGTLLHAARLCHRREVPILGVNLGTLGFMTEVPRDHVLRAMEHVLEGAFRTSLRSKLRVQVLRADETLVDSEVLNDVVIGKNALARIADIEVSVDGEWVTTFQADGMIVATPTGSSAYSLAAGGPLVHPSVAATLIVPICPHTLTQRPLVVPDSSRIEMILASDSEMFVTLDGQSGRALARGDRVVVQRASTSVPLVRHESPGYFGLLRSKLRWGGR